MCRSTSRSKNALILREQAADPSDFGDAAISAIRGMGHRDPATAFHLATQAWYAWKTNRQLLPRVLIELNGVLAANFMLNHLAEERDAIVRRETCIRLRLRAPDRASERAPGPARSSSAATARTSASTIASS